MSFFGLTDIIFMILRISCLDKRMVVLAVLHYLVRNSVPSNWAMIETMHDALAKDV